MKSDNTEDEDKRQNKHHHGVHLQAGRLVSVEPCSTVSISSHKGAQHLQVHLRDHHSHATTIVPSDPVSAHNRPILIPITYSAWCCWSRRHRRIVCSSAWHWQSSPSGRRQLVVGWRYGDRPGAWETKVGREQRPWPRQRGQVTKREGKTISKAVALAEGTRKTKTSCDSRPPDNGKTWRMRNAFPASTSPDRGAGDREC